MLQHELEYLKPANALFELGVEALDDGLNQWCKAAAMLSPGSRDELARRHEKLRHVVRELIEATSFEACATLTPTNKGILCMRRMLSGEFQAIEDLAKEDKP